GPYILQLQHIASRRHGAHRADSASRGQLSDTHVGDTGGSPFALRQATPGPDTHNTRSQDRNTPSGTRNTSPWDCNTGPGKRNTVGAFPGNAKTAHPCIGWALSRVA